MNQTHPLNKVFDRYLRLEQGLYLKACHIARTLSNQREAGLGTLEVVVITGVLLAIALLFNQQIRSFAQRLFRQIFNQGRFSQIFQ